MFQNKTIIQKIKQTLHYNLLLFIVLLSSSSFSQEEKINFYKLEIPKILNKDFIINHTGYSLSYNEKYKQANWVAYELTKEKTNTSVKRANKFTKDPMIKTQSADDEDYKKSGYDRGHLAPAADMKWSETAMKESFYYSNMSPQIPGFNRGIWKQAEELVRNWAKEYGKIYIATGPVFSDQMKSIGHNEVAVPTKYYKVILRCNDNECFAIGFIIPNESSKEPLESFTVSIDSVEKSTGIDFFPSLPDTIENQVESKFYLKEWNWKTPKSKKKNKNQ
ncbi:MAG: DNA/RNA non-specific endonuclease [Flavobacterium sp.]